MPTRPDRDNDLRNRSLELRAGFFNTVGALITVLGLVGGPLVFIAGDDLLPPVNWLIIGAVLVGVGLHVLALKTLKAMR